MPSKKPGGWYTAYTRVYPPIHHLYLLLLLLYQCVLLRSYIRALQHIMGAAEINNLSVQIM